jgi:hypothetical protein
VRPAVLLALLLTCSLVAGASPATAALTAPETLRLDAFDPANDGDAGPVATSDVLQVGRQYVADVSGTFSPFNAKVWAFHDPSGCGSLEPHPMTPSPGAVDTVVGQDAEVRFGIPWKWRCPALPQHGGGFQMDVGAGFSHFAAVGGPYSAPTPGHFYSYPMVGQGQPARFRIVDNPTADDNGILTIVVRPAEAAPAPAPEAPAAEPQIDSAPTTVLPSNKTCLRTRRIFLRLKARKGDAITGATVRVNGRTVRSVHRRRGHTRRVLDMYVKVAGKRTGRASVVVVARTRRGKAVVTRKRYRLCRG